MQDYSQFEYPEDIKRIVEAFRLDGLECSPSEACEMWEGYSEDYAAGWIYLPEHPKDIVDCLRTYWTVQRTSLEDT